MRILIIASFLWGSLINASDLDLLYDDSQVAIIEITMDPMDLQWMYEHVQSDSLHPATIHFSNAFIDETHEQVGIRIRGNTSRNAAKKSFKISFNTFVPGRKFYDVEKLNLNGEHNDPSIMRSKLAWDFYAKTGLETTRAAHCALYINEIFYGLYVSIEHIDEEFLKNHFEDDTGNLWKCLWPADLTYRGPNPEDYHPYQSDTHPYELKTNKSAYDYSELAHLIDIINNTPVSEFADSLEQVIDVHEVLQYAAMNVVTGNWDEYWFLRNNFYLYHEPTTDRFHWIPYDYDNSFGIDWFNVDWAQVDPYEFITIEDTQGQDTGDRPLMQRIMDVDAYRDLYTHFLEFYSGSIVQLSNWEDHVDNLRSVIEPYALADTFRTMDYGFTIPDFYQSYSPVGYVNQHVKYGLKEFVNQRQNSLVDQVVYANATPIIYDIQYSPKIIGPGDSIHVSVAAYSHIGLDELVIAFHPSELTTVLSYPMNPTPITGTTIVEDMDRWTGVIPPIGEYGHGRFQIGAGDYSGQTSLYPGGHFIEVQVTQPQPHALCINEFMAKNDSTVSDPAGEYDDWLEIYNSADTDTYLSGLYLTDNPDNLTKWQFPSGGNYLLPHSHLLVWCDEDSDQQGVHLNFKLSGSGEFLALVDIDGQTIIDAINFGPQEADISYGRESDGAENWAYFSEASPGFSNSNSRISETQRPNRLSLVNYPNPFNGQTIIRFTLEHSSFSELLVYDLQGKPIVSLLASELEKGSHTVNWDGRNAVGRPVSAGVYVLSLQLAGQNWTRKVVYLK